VEMHEVESAYLEGKCEENVTTALTSLQGRDDDTVMLESDSVSIGDSNAEADDISVSDATFKVHAAKALEELCIVDDYPAKFSESMKSQDWNVQFHITSHISKNSSPRNFLYQIR
jgi:hypothetical protein